MWLDSSILVDLRCVIWSSSSYAGISWLRVQAPSDRYDHLTAEVLACIYRTKSPPRTLKVGAAVGGG